jgi:hypothetical protein
LNRTLDDSKKGRFPNMMIAVLYMRNNDTEGAIKYLQKAFQEREGAMVYVNVEPIFHPLHADPRYQEIVQSMGLGK